MSKVINRMKCLDAMRLKMKCFLVFAFLFSGIAFAHESGSDVVPQRERRIAQDLQATGPKENKGISVSPLGNVSLEGELPGAAGKILRAREITIAPGGVVAVHQHEGRPGLAYILEGEVYEHRNDETGSVLRRAGAVSFEKTGVTHWWENKSDQKMRAIVVDIVPAELANPAPAATSHQKPLATSK
jgi:quercetin dioxygenase-like cupin family protein